MTREEWKEWALSLEPGDTVVIERWGPTYMKATVQKITPTGRVNTDKGVFAMNEWSGTYCGYGKTNGHLMKPTTELLEKAEKYEKEEADRKRKQEAINKAQKFAWELYVASRNMDYATAEKLLRVKEMLEGENHG